ncbi:MAG: membrane protein insertase YidC [Saccharofermentans sp.]|nr:membrane protein insertase YidC [Saccharofermentans sp.]
MIFLNVLIEPLKLLFEFIFSTAYKIVPVPAVDIIFLSLAVNLMCFPLYHRADSITKANNEKQKALAPMIDHIKKCFKGDEKIMMLQTFYKQNDYSPLSSLKSTLSLLLQIPFFIAAYSFLSSLALLEGQSLGPVKDLMSPDGLIAVGGITVNVLPILMTVINIISSEIYTRGQPFKSKIILYVSALVFLVLLYNCPAGLVFYWTLNNTFSLVKNLIPFKVKETGEEKKEKPGLAFFFAAIYITVFTGLLIPSQVIAASPAEFTNLMSFDYPTGYVYYAVQIAAGLFLFWPAVYYLLMTPKWRKRLDLAAVAVAIVITADYLFFGPVGKRISDVLAIDGTYGIGIIEKLFNIAVIAGVAVLVALVCRRFPLITNIVVSSGVVAVTAMSVINIVRIRSDIDEFLASGARSVSYSSLDEENKMIRLSKDGRNVVVIMVDRAIGGFVPYLFAEKPVLAEQFDGFTYYSNAISYGNHTYMGAPGIYGGYEYIPQHIVENTDMGYVAKHNEATLMMPVLFSRNGFHASVLDPVDGDLAPVPDLTIFDPYENVDGYVVAGTLDSNSDKTNANLKSVRERNMLRYSIMRTAPAVFFELLYDSGNYNYLQRVEDDREVSVYQLPYSMSEAEGYNANFTTAYSVLTALNDLTDYNAEGDNLMILTNNSTHEPSLLQEPMYVPAVKVDNRSYDAENTGRFDVNGRHLEVSNYDSMAHYHVNMAVYLALGEWFDHLRENGVWDNTRIIIVSDHGRALSSFEELKNDELGIDFEEYNCVLMVKDFDQTGFTTSDELMTNADVPTLATKGIIESPVNPFTGNPINSDEKSEGPLVIGRYEMSTEENEQERALIARWYSVRDNIWIRSNWEYMGER